MKPSVKMIRKICITCKKGFYTYWPHQTECEPCIIIYYMASKKENK